MDNFENDIDLRMCQTIKSLESNISKLRTGRASPTLLDNIYVEYFGANLPLKKIANILVEDSCTLKINVFDISILNQVQKSILNSNLGLNPIKSGNIIRVIFPTLTEERRKQLIKLVRRESEKSKISIRNIRRESNEKLKSSLKNNTVSKDKEFLYQNKIQKITDFYIKKIDLIISLKEKELMIF